MSKNSGFKAFIVTFGLIASSISLLGCKEKKQSNHPSDLGTYYLYYVYYPTANPPRVGTCTVEGEVRDGFNWCYTAVTLKFNKNKTCLISGSEVETSTASWEDLEGNFLKLIYQEKNYICEYGECTTCLETVKMNVTEEGTENFCTFVIDDRIK